MKKFALEMCHERKGWVRLQHYSNLTEHKANFLYRLCEMASDAFSNPKTMRIVEQNENL